MGDLIRFPVERRRPPCLCPPGGHICDGNAQYAATVAEGPGVTMKLTTVNGEPVEYVSGAYWFGVRIRPPVTPA